MPQVTATVHVPVSPAVAFAVAQTTGEVRLRWDPFIRKQYFLNGATAAGKDVESVTHARLGPKMTSRYVSYRPPTNTGMTMVEGPWFFKTFGGGWRFHDDGAGGTDAVWKYTYSVRPRWLQPIGHRIGQVLLGREIRKRIDAYAAACSDPAVLAAVAE